MAMLKTYRDYKQFFTVPVFTSDLQFAFRKSLLLLTIDMPRNQLKETC